MFRNNLRKESLIVIPREEINIANNIADIAGLPTLKKKVCATVSLRPSQNLKSHSSAVSA